MRLGQTIKEAMEADALDLARQVWPEKPSETRDPKNMAWHVVRCVDRSDGQVLDWLDRLKVERYYPMVREMRRLPKRKMSLKQRNSGITIERPRLVPFLPRYAFVRFDMGRPGWRELFGFAGIAGMVCSGDLPVRVPDALIVSMKARELDGAIPGKTPAKLIFELGETVRVSSGPFHSFNAVVEKLPDVPIDEIDSETRIRVSVHVFAQPTPVDLEIGQIEKL